MRLGRNNVRLALNPSQPPGRASGLLALALVYVVWGTTFLAIRHAVRGDGAMPPFLLGALRMGLASALLYALCAGRGESLRMSLRSWGRAAAAGTLMWLGGNGLVIAAVTRLDSGITAVLMATTPVFAAVLFAIRARRVPGPRRLAGLAIGTAGVALLVGVGGGGLDPVGVALVLAAALSFAVGSMIRPPDASPLLSAASMLWVAAIGFSLVSAVLGEPLVVPSARALVALGYLVVVGTAVGFVAYLHALARLSTSLVMTHAYVNPLIAVLVGCAFAGESITAMTAVAGGLILVSVPLNR